MLLERAASLSPHSPQNTLHHHHQHHHHEQQYQHQHQHQKFHLPGSSVSKKRRLSNGSPSSKRARPAAEHHPMKFSSHKRHEYPVFQSPDVEGLLQQTPYGMLKVTKRGKVETKLIDRSICLESFSDGTQLQRNMHSDDQGMAQARHNVQPSQQWQSSQQQVGLDDMNSSTTPAMMEGRRKMQSSPSPSVEIEGYMMEGYDMLPMAASGATNKSYRYHEEEILNVNYGLYDADFNECDDNDVEGEEEDDGDCVM